jgi:predicted DNA-binding transcriptional regulator YafY
MRAARLMSLLLHLQTRGQLTVRELAERLEVSERTVQRDVAALAESGIPVRAVRGPAGGYRLGGGYRTKLTGLSTREAEALAFLGLSGPAAELGFGDSLDAARVKMLAALTSEGRERVERAAARFHVDPVRWYATAEPTPALPAVTQALWEDRRIRIKYSRRDKQVRTRVVDPLGLVLASGNWYLTAAHKESRRSYRVSRLLEVRVLDEPAHRPDGFLLAEAWAASRRELENSHEQIEITLRADGAVLPRLRKLVAVSGQNRIDLTTPPGTRVELTVPFEGHQWALTTLLGLGGAVEVLAPDTLRTAIRREVQQMAAKYQISH